MTDTTTTTAPGSGSEVYQTKDRRGLFVVNGSGPGRWGVQARPGGGVSIPGGVIRRGLFVAICSSLEAAQTVADGLAVLADQFHGAAWAPVRLGKPNPCRCGVPGGTHRQTCAGSDSDAAWSTSETPAARYVVAAVLHAFGPQSNADQRARDATAEMARLASLGQGFVVVRRDAAVMAVLPTVDAAHAALLHVLQGNSVDHATRWEGWTVERVTDLGGPDRDTSGGAA